MQAIAEQGGSVCEVMAQHSHSDRKTSAIYIKRVEITRLAKQAADRVTATIKGQGVRRPENRGIPAGASPNVVKISRKIWQPVGESNPSFQVENLAS